MSALSPILRKAQGNRLHFWCPGCDQAHGIAFGDGPGPRWEWNGDVDSPTFRPSIMVNRGHENPAAPVCHSFVTNGQIEFLADCTHEMAGKTVRLREWPGYDAGDS